MADEDFIAIERSGGWWQLRRSFDGSSEPSGFVLVVKRKHDGKSNEWRGTSTVELIGKAIPWLQEGREVRRVRKPKKRA